MEKHDVDEMYAFLDDLQDLGIVNMFAAPGYLQEEFEMSDEDSIAVVSNWMDTKEKQAMHTVSMEDVMKKIEDIEEEEADANE